MTASYGLTTLFFYAICIMIACYVTFEQLTKYLKNEDSSSISIKSFATSQKNKYPDVSICFPSYEGKALFNESQLPDSLSDSNMRRIIVGKVAGLNNEIIDAGSTFLKNLAYGSQNDYEDILINPPKNVIEKSEVVSHNIVLNKKLTSGNQRERTQDHNSVLWLNAKTSCLTRNLRYEPYEVLERQTILLRRKSMSSYRIFYVFIHRPGHLIRQVGSNMITNMALRAMIPRKYDTRTNLLQVFITSLKIIKKRSKPDDPCDEELEDDDQKWIRQVSKNIGCVPIYWIKQSDIVTNSSKVAPCASYEEYQEANVASRDGKINITRQYHPPCQGLVHLSYSTAGNALLEGILQNKVNNLKKNDQIMLRIQYKLSNYEEVRNGRAFNEYDLFTQVGGAIGLMLGFSFFQLPNIFIDWTLKIKIKLSKLKWSKSEMDSSKHR